MKNIYQRYTAFRERSNTYFSKNEASIAESNYALLKHCTKIFFWFLTAYGIFTYFLLNSMSLLYIYGVFLVIDLCFLLFVTHQKQTPSYSAVENLCILFSDTILAFVIAISVVPFPERPSIFFSLGYMIVVVLFMLPYQKMNAILCSAVIVFFIITKMLKSPISASYDYFAGFTTWILGYFFLSLITELRLKNGEVIARLEQLSQTDSLTGLLNRRGSDEMALRNFKRCQNLDLPFAVFMLDIDNFKKFNDTLGHQQGDVCLKMLGELFLSYAHELGILAVRYGGEEFLFILSNCSSQSAIVSAEDLLTRIRTLAIPSPDGTVTASLGVAVLQHSKENGSLEELIHEADLALYESKRAGKNQASVHLLD